MCRNLRELRIVCRALEGVTEADLARLGRCERERLAGLLASALWLLEGLEKKPANSGFWQTTKSESRTGIIYELNQLGRWEY